MPTHQPSRRLAGAPVRRIGMLSTYPPKLCGLATFAAALTHALRDAGHRVDVVRVNDGSDPSPIGQQVAAELINGSPTSVRSAAVTLSRCDTVIVQHEYGIFGGSDGDEILDLLDLLSVPAIVVLHTVPLSPTDHQRQVLESLCDLAASVVVMTESAHQRLAAMYDVDPFRVAVITHGAAMPADHLVTGNGRPFGERPQLLTWGLLGPGKGIEHAIDAVGMLGAMQPHLRYTVAGVTHPKVFAQHGDTYRHSLIRRTWANGVAGSVTFDDTYRNVGQLTRFIASSTLVVLPYDSRDQVTSGVLIDAVAAGRPVIATAFPHATELALTGAVAVVPHADPAALAEMIRSVMGEPGRLAAMTAAAAALAPSLSWASVADRYLAVCEDLDGLTATVAI